MRGHENDMRYAKDKATAIHYRSYNHTAEDYIVQAIDYQEGKNERLRLEEAWMVLLDTIYPKGLNQRW